MQKIRFSPDCPSEPFDAADFNASERLSVSTVQLDQNYLPHHADSRAVPNTKRGIDPNKISYSALDRLPAYESFNGERKINDCKLIDARTGFEYDEDGNCINTIAQWFPRMSAYTDYAGWINKQYLGTGEFTLDFGHYKVSLTVPDDHIVAATGTLQNEDAVLSKTQRERLRQARNAIRKPMFIVTPAAN